MKLIDSDEVSSLGGNWISGEEMPCCKMESVSLWGAAVAGVADVADGGAAVAAAVAGVAGVADVADGADVSDVAKRSGEVTLTGWMILLLLYLSLSTSSRPYVSALQTVKLVGYLPSCLLFLFFRRDNFLFASLCLHSASKLMFCMVADSYLWWQISSDGDA